MTDETQPQNSGASDPVIQPIAADGSLPSGLGEPIDASLKLPPHPNTTFSDDEFLRLLSGSISLTKAEKLRIIERIPTLSQAQVDRLTEIFQEEQVKFSSLKQSHSSEVSALEQQSMEDWQDVESQKQEESARTAEAERIAELQKKLGGQ